MFQTKILDDYKGYGKCLYMTNGIVDIVETLDIGPRIVRYGYVDGTNIMNDCIEQFNKDDGEKLRKYYGEDAFYCTYGGHRLWISPEYYPEMYYPDNYPVEYEIIENGAVFTQVPQKENGLQYKITVILSEGSADVTVNHEVLNFSDRTKEFALWALTLAAKGGVEIIPMNTNNTHLLPNRKVVLWPYTNPQADYIFLGKKYATVQQPPEGQALKLGFDLMNSKAYYVIDDVVFKKEYDANYPNGVYPDGGASFETYSCSWFTELETLGELKKVAPNETIFHEERWTLYSKPCEVDYKDETSIASFIEKL